MFKIDTYPSLEGSETHHAVRFGSTGAESAEDEWPAHGRITASSFPQSLFSEPGSQWGLTVASLRGGQLADDITSGQSAIPTVRHQDVTVQQSIADGTSSKVCLAVVEGIGKVAFKAALRHSADGQAAVECRHALEISAAFTVHEVTRTIASGFVPWKTLSSFLVRPVACVLRESDTPGGQPTIAGILLQYCEGGCLQSHIEKAWSSGTRPVHAPAALYCLALQCAGATAAINRAGIAHRDIIPDNVLLDRPLSSLDDIRIGDVKLTDLKSSAFCLGRDREWAVVSDVAASGSAVHVAPEALEAGPKDEYAVTVRHDSFSVGIVMLLLLCHRLPWRGKTPEQVQAMVRDGSVISCIAECASGAPAAYVNIALWLCDNNPAERILCVRAHSMLQRLHAATAAGRTLSVEDLAREFNCARHKLLGQFRVQDAVNTDDEDTGCVMLPCPPAASVSLERCGNSALGMVAQSMELKSVSGASAETCASGSESAGGQRQPAEAPGSPPEPTVERRLGEVAVGDAMPVGGSGSRGGAVKGGWMRRLRAKCGAALRKMVARRKRC